MHIFLRIFRGIRKMIPATIYNFSFYHRLAEIGKDLWNTYWPSHLLKQNRIQSDFDYHLQEWIVHSPSRQLVPELGDPHRKREKLYICIYIHVYKPCFCFEKETCFISNSFPSGKGKGLVAFGKTSKAISSYRE